MAAGVNVEPPVAACGGCQLSITGRAEEVSVTCEAWHRTKHYFQAIGLPFDPRVSVLFRDDVELQTRNGQRQLALGIYNAAEKVIELVRWTTPRNVDRSLWGVPLGRELVLSTATHELTHAGLWELLQTNTFALDSVWQEFVASAVQFEVMDVAMRSAILERFHNSTPFADPANVNAVVYAFDPALFGLRAYLSTQAWGGPTFLWHLIVGEVDFSTKGAFPEYP